MPDLSPDECAASGWSKNPAVGSDVFTKFLNTCLNTPCRILPLPGEFHTRVVDQFDYLVTPLAFDLTLEIQSAEGLGSARGWRMLQVYGSNDSTLSTDGTLMRVGV